MGQCRASDKGQLSRIYAVNGCAEEPQRREGRREKTKGDDARSNHHSVTQFQVAESGLSLCPSRLCGLKCLCSIAWLRLSRTADVLAGLKRGNARKRTLSGKDENGVSRRGRRRSWTLSPAPWVKV